VLSRKSLEFPPKKDRRKITRSWSLKLRSRLVAKRKFAKLWVKEKGFRRYRYNVEKCTDGSIVYLTRPTRNAGVDFQVCVEGFRSRKSGSNRPSHPDVVLDLRRKLRAKPRLKKELFYAISDVFECVEPSRAIRRHPRILKLAVGLPIDKVLRVIKWLFIEQDVAYWLGTGRNMLMHEIEKRVFKIKGELYHE
jgi:hypothetical protein